MQIGLDPQSSLEVLAGLGSNTPPERTVSRLLMPEEFRDSPLEAVVHITPWGTELIPASKALATAERALGDPTRGGANQRLKRGLESLNTRRSASTRSTRRREWDNSLVIVDRHRPDAPR